MRKDGQCMSNKKPPLETSYHRSHKIPKAKMMRYQPNGFSVWLARNRRKNLMANHAVMKDTTNPMANIGTSDPCKIGKVLYRSNTVAAKIIGTAARNE